MRVGVGRRVRNCWKWMLSRREIIVGGWCMCFVFFVCMLFGWERGRKVAVSVGGAGRIGVLF